MSTVGGRSLAASALVALAIAAVLFLAWRSLDPLDARGLRELREALTERGRVAVVGFSDPSAIEAPGAQVLAAREVRGLTAALDGTDPEALAHILASESLDALLLAPSVGGQGRSVGERLARFEPLPGVCGLQLSGKLALYAPEPLAGLSEAERSALALVARRVVGGERSPQIGSFPASMRRLIPVEVMVLLRQHEQARLWRSARGNSLARALLTAAEVARERWHEREQAMGGPLDPLLPKLQVEVALLLDDGTVTERTPAFIDRAFFPEHGIGYENKGSWRYMLPDARASLGSPSAAYKRLFADNGLPTDSFDRHELRFYRLRVATLAVSKPEPPPKDGLSAPATPDEIIAPPPKPAP